ncbi:DUF72 domain-containing protein [Peredibacter starrii]|uniref:DUF72 domain-containing protein n=1 Tax=Peredibacter starrii TaxID=28202 RepID=A0AAX4HNF1_9BACT|nr:DUF72 domain-containing protein [Peredibacter starrii]WPU64789.1 DUF72 domain-containing protein [Peredibacter starrii]
MEFGKLEDISLVDWHMPSDDPKNAGRLLTAQKDHKLYFGSPAWGNKHWVGKIYPAKTPPEKFLYYYSRNFNSIELNTTHYRIPDEATVKEWTSQVPEDFLFCPKLFKDISHNRVGMVDKPLLNSWLDTLPYYGKNLGPCFVQFHEQFSYTDKVLLFKFLENWPSDFRLSLELRHPSWFENGKILPALTDYLNKKNIGLVITDVAGRRDVLHSSVSAPWTMIRLIGNDLDPSDEIRLYDWAERLNSWAQMGLQETFLFLHQEADTHTIEFAQMAEEIFNGEGFPDVPNFTIEEERDLFNYE